MLMESVSNSSVRRMHKNRQVKATLEVFGSAPSVLPHSII